VRRRVRWSQAAAGDVVAVSDWIARDDLAAAHAVLETLEVAAQGLAELADRGREVREVAGLGPWRELVVAPWRLIYRLEPEEVVVLAVVDGRRQLRDVLFDRLVRPR
jgi:toxin ParE1/3/4